MSAEEPRRVMVEVEMVARVIVKVEVEIDPSEPDGDPSDLTPKEVDEAIETAMALVSESDWQVESAREVKP